MINRNHTTYDGHQETNEEVVVTLQFQF